MEENIALLDELASENDPSLTSLIRDEKARLMQEVEERRRWETERECERNESFE
jgi:hypothetical protein